jgi:CheY-like chemotaxis protein
MLLDIRLPGIDAWEVLRRLEDRGGPPARIPVLICSAHSDPAIVAKASEFNCEGYLTKPFSAETLVTAVDGVLRNGGTTGA